MIRNYPLSWLCIAVIWILCLCRTPQVEIDFELSFGLDKVAHFIMYAGTCGTIWWEYLRSHQQLNRRRLFLFALVAPIVMSCCVELAQSYATDYRSADWGDVLANAIGALFGNVTGYTLLRRFLWEKPEK